MKKELRQYRATPPKGFVLDQDEPTQSNIKLPQGFTLDSDKKKVGSQNLSTSSNISGNTNLSLGGEKNNFTIPHGNTTQRLKEREQQLGYSQTAAGKLNKPNDVVIDENDPVKSILNPLVEQHQVATKNYDPYRNISVSDATVNKILPTELINKRAGEIKNKKIAENVATANLVNTESAIRRQFDDVEKSRQVLDKIKERNGGVVPEDNLTGKFAKDKLDSYNKWADKLKSSAIVFDAIDEERKSNPTFDQQYQVLTKNGDDIPKTLEGQIVSNYINRHAKDLQSFVKENPDFRDDYEDLTKNFTNRYPETASANVQRKLLQAIEDKRSGWNLAHIGTSGFNSNVDKLATQILSPEEQKLYNEQLKGDKSWIKTNDFANSGLRAFGRGFENTKEGVSDLVGGNKLSNDIYSGLKYQAENTLPESKGIRDIENIAGDFTGTIWYMALETAILKRLGLPAKIASKAPVFNTFYHDMYRQGEMKFADKNKATVSAIANTTMFMVFSDIFPQGKVSAAIKKLKPKVDNVIKKAAANEGIATLKGRIAEALRSQVTQWGKGVGEMNLFNQIDQALDHALGLKGQQFEQAHPEDEAYHTTKQMLAGGFLPSLIHGVGRFNEIKPNELAGAINELPNGVYTSPLKEAIKAKDYVKIGQYLKDISEQLSNPQSKTFTRNVFGDKLSDIATKLYPNAKSEPINVEQPNTASTITEKTDKDLGDEIMGDAMKEANDRMRKLQLEKEFAGENGSLSYKSENKEIRIGENLGGTWSVNVSDRDSSSDTGFRINEGDTKEFKTKLEALDYAKTIKDADRNTTSTTPTTEQTGAEVRDTKNDKAGVNASDNGLQDGNRNGGGDVGSETHLKVSADTKSALESGRKKQVVTYDENGNPKVDEVSFDKEDAELELERLEKLAERGRLTPEEFQKSYFGQATDLVTFKEASDRIKSDQKGFIADLKKSFLEESNSGSGKDVGGEKVKEFAAKSDKHFEYVPIEEIEPYKEHDREAEPKNDLDALTEDIKKNGIQKPIQLKVDRNGNALIVEGNTRLAAAKRLGIKNIPVEITEGEFGSINKDKTKKLPEMGMSEIQKRQRELPIKEVNGAYSKGFTKIEPIANTISGGKEDVGGETVEKYYHGTKKDFKEFDESQMGGTDDGWYGKGFYFHTDKNRGGYGDIVKEAKLDLTNPIQLPVENAGQHLYDIVGEKAGLDKSFRNKSAMSIVKEIGADNFSKIAKELGYDGVVVNYAEGSKEVVVFDKGKINITNQDINKSNETSNSVSGGKEDVGDKTVVGAKPKPIDENSIAASQKWIRDLLSLPDYTRIKDEDGNIYQVSGGKIRKLTFDKDGNLIDSETIWNEKATGAYSNPKFWESGYEILDNGNDKVLQSKPNENTNTTTNEIPIPSKEESPTIKETNTNIQSAEEGKAEPTEPISKSNKGEPPSTEPPVEGGEKPPKGNKALANRLVEADNVSEQSKSGIRDKGLRYEPQSQKEAEQVAKSVIDAIGIDDAVDKARAQTFGGDVNTLIQTESLNRLKELEDAAKTPEEKRAYAEKFAEISIALDEWARDKAGRGISALNFFYKKSPLGIQIAENVKRSEAFKDWSKSKEQSWKEFFNELRKEPDFEKEVQEVVSKEIKAERAKERTERKERVHKAIDDTMAKWAKKLKAKGTDDVQKQGIGVDEVFKAAAATMKKAYDAGEAVIKIVNEAIEYISKQLGRDDWGKEEFKKEWEQKLADKNQKKKFTDEELKTRILDKFRKKLKGLTDKEKEEVVRRSFKQLIENGALEYGDFKKIISDVTGRGEMNADEAKRLRELVEKTNEVEKAAKELQEKRTEEAFIKYRASMLETAKATKELNEMLWNKPNIMRRLTSIMQLNTLGIPSLINNPIYNIWNQMLVRFPVGIVNDAIDRGLAGAAKLVGKSYEREYNVWETQAAFFRGLGIGTKESLEQFLTGLNRQDLFQKEIYGQQIRPFKSWRDLIDWKMGKKKLSPKEVMDRSLQATYGIPAEIIARTLNIGDKPQRFGAESAQGAAFAKTLGLKGMDYKLFMEFPKEEAYRAYKKRGLSDEDAAKKSEYIKSAIEKEGQRSTFQQDNLLNDLINKMVGGEKSGAGQFAKAIAISPFIKIPSNAFWSAYNLINPEIAILQAMYHGGRAYKLRGDSTTSSLQLREARYWFAHAVVGVALRATIIPMVAAGIFNSQNTKDDTKKEREGEQNFEQQGAVNLTKLMVYLRGGDPSKVNGGLTLQNRWLGQFGVIGNSIASKWDEMTQEQKDKQRDFWDDAFGGLEVEGLREAQNGIFSNTSSILNAIDTKGSFGFDQYFRNTIGMMENTFHPAMFSQVSRQQLDYVPQYKGDSFVGELKNDILTRSSIIRKLSGQYPPSKITIWGEPLKRPDNTLMRLFGVSKTNEGNFAYPIYQDYKKTGDIGFFPPAVSPNLYGQKINVQQQNVLETYVGQARKSLIAPYVNDGAYIAGFDKQYSEIKDVEVKKMVLGYLYELGRIQGVKKFIDENEQFKKKNKTEYEQEINDAFEEFKQDVKDQNPNE